MFLPRFCLIFIHFIKKKKTNTKGQTFSPIYQYVSYRNECFLSYSEWWQNDNFHVHYSFKVCTHLHLFFLLWSREHATYLIICTHHHRCWNTSSVCKIVIPSPPSLTLRQPGLSWEVLCGEECKMARFTGCDNTKRHRMENANTESWGDFDLPSWIKRATQCLEFIWMWSYFKGFPVKNCSIQCPQH